MLCRFKAFIEVAGCRTKNKKTYFGCKNIRELEDTKVKPKIYTVKCIHGKNAITKKMYYSQKNNKNYIYSVNLPIGCKQHTLKVSTKYTLENLKSIPEISKNKTLNGKRIYK